MDDDPIAALAKAKSKQPGKSANRGRSAAPIVPALPPALDLDPWFYKDPRHPYLKPGYMDKDKQIEGLRQLDVPEQRPFESVESMVPRGFGGAMIPFRNMIPRGDRIPVMPEPDPSRMAYPNRRPVHQ